MQTMEILKFFALIVICEGLQASGFGLMRSVGAQKQGLIIAFIGFYIIASSIGYALLLKTNLKLLGFWIGYCIGAFCMFIAQMLFILRIDWVKTADEVRFQIRTLIFKFI